MSELAWTGWALLALVVVLVALWVVWGAASRLDRLHRRVLEARMTLDAQLVRRATAAWDLATAGILDPVSSLLVASVAREALDHVPGAEHPPGEEPPAAGRSTEGAPENEPEEEPRSGGRRRAGGVPRPAVDGDWAMGAPWESPEEISQSMAESELSRVLREALGDVTDRAELAADPAAAQLLARLDQEWYRAQLARRFYNEAVVQVRRIRAKGYVRLFRLAGRAPNPQTIEMDDATGLP